MESGIPDDETDACDGCDSDSPWNMERCYDTACDHVGTGQNTLPLAQLNFQTQFGTNYNLAFASYILALIPILIFYMICQKQILNGVANGAVKG